MIVTDTSGQPREVRCAAKCMARAAPWVLAGTSIEEVARTSRPEVADMVAWHDPFIDGGIAHLMGEPSDGGRSQ